MNVAAYEEPNLSDKVGRIFGIGNEIVGVLVISAVGVHKEPVQRRRGHDRNSNVRKRLTQMTFRYGSETGSTHVKVLESLSTDGSTGRETALNFDDTISVNQALLLLKWIFCC